MNAAILLIIGIPAIEIYLMIKVGGIIGALNTILLIFFTAITGVYFAKIAGLSTLRSGFNQLIKNEIPIYEIISGAALAFAAFLLIAPAANILELSPCQPFNITVMSTLIISPSCKIGKSVIIHHKDLVNLYGCIIGESTQIGPFVEIQKNVVIGEKCKISSHSFICEGVKIEDRVFVGHGVMFINDIYPQAANEYGDLQSEDDWQIIETFVQSLETSSNYLYSFYLIL